MRKILVTLILLVCIFTFHVRAVYVAMKEGERRCFYEEVPGNTYITGHFESVALENPTVLGSSNNELGVGEQDAPPNPITLQNQAKVATDLFNGKQFEIKVEIYLPEDTPIFEQSYKRSDTFQFTSHDGGTYKICFQTSSSAWFGGLTFKFKFDLETGSDANDYTNIAKKEHLNNVELEVRQLYDRSQGVIKELEYQKEREIAFRSTSESTNARAAWFSVFQLCVIIGSAFIQMQYLRLFFKKKKLI